MPSSTGEGPEPILHVTYSFVDSVSAYDSNVDDTPLNTYTDTATGTDTDTATDTDTDPATDTDTDTDRWYHSVSVCLLLVLYIMWYIMITFYSLAAT